MSAFREVDADLVRAARFELNGDERRVFEAFEGPIPRDSPPPRLSGTGHSAAQVAAVAHEVGRECPGFRKASAHDRRVLALDVVALEEVLEEVQRLAGSREDDRPGSV